MGGSDIVGNFEEDGNGEWRTMATMSRISKEMVTVNFENSHFYYRKLKFVPK